jgi:hypothetical protein
MNAEILLDFEGDLPEPKHVRVIENEVEFLRYATSEQPLLIRGKNLCRWAEAFYSLRSIPVQYVQSPRAILRRIYPSLTAEQADEIARKIGKNMLTDNDCSPANLLTVCYPEDRELWYGNPTQKHAAQWLVWLIEHSPSEAEQVLLSQFIESLRGKGIPAELTPLYEAKTQEQAKAFLLRWLGNDPDPFYLLEEFPLEKQFSTRLAEWVKEAWQKQIIKSQGDFFIDRLSFPLRYSWRKELADLTARFFKQNPTRLKAHSIDALRPYLDEQNLKELESALPPKEPSAMPQREAEVLKWFEKEYLPYRRWQSNFGEESARQTILKHAHTFARWVLDRYPAWLLEGEWISFQKSAQLSKPESDRITLCVILDGLPAWDAMDLLKKLTEEVPRLALLDQAYCFAPIPTITEYAKDALLKGTRPRYATELPPLGRVLSERDSTKQMKQAHPGEVWFWRVEQPDKGYHFTPPQKLPYKVQSELGAIVKEISEIVDSVNQSYNFHLIITSDHGRLMNPKSIRRLRAADGMETHGRVAWGKLDRIFPESGYALDENEGWVELFHERYGLPTDVRIIWSEESFLTSNESGGEEPYPHGGLFPEEMIVPWFVFARDAQIPKPEIFLKGSGEAKMSGDLHISIINPSQLTLECVEVRLSNGAKVSGQWQIAPQSEQSLRVSISPWPKKSETANLWAKLVFRQPTGLIFDCEVTPQIEVKTLYEKDDALLRDLEL